MNPLDSATGQKTGMEVIVLDNGFQSRGEHSYRLLLEVGDALSRRKIAHRIFGVRDADASAVADIGAIPWFTKSLYWSGRQRLPSLRNFASDSLSLMRSLGARGYHYSEEATSRVLNKTYRRDLKRLPSDVWAPDNLIVVPAITQNQIFGLVQHLLALPASAQPTVVCQLMFTPAWTPWNCNGCHGVDYYQQAFRLAAPLIGKSLFFTTENDALAQIYLQVFNLKTGLLPIVTQMPHAASQPEGTIKLGFFGYSKSEKGFHLLPEAIELCRARNLPAQFVVQIQHTNWEHETVETEKVLRQIPISKSSMARSTRMNIPARSMRLMRRFCLTTLCASVCAARASTPNPSPRAAGRCRKRNLRRTWHRTGRGGGRSIRALYRPGAGGCDRAIIAARYRIPVARSAWRPRLCGATQWGCLYRCHAAVRPATRGIER